MLNYLMKHYVEALVIAAIVLYVMVPDILDRLQYVFRHITTGIRECLSPCGAGMIMNKNGDCVKM